ncbi:hypothetical protein DSM26151_28120 [Agromyces marinus]|nr:hypothetical protein DSM26151_28120 [Agromyces marinus]
MPVAIAVAVLVPIQANASVDLPDMTPEELVAFAKAGEVEALSGTIEQRSELGLPDLGAVMGGGGMSGAGGSETDAAASDAFGDLVSLATGSFDANVYLDGDHARLQVLDRMAERNVYLSPGEAWFVDSEAQTATRLGVDPDADVDGLKAELARLADEAKAEAAAKAEAELPDGEQLPTPQQLLDRALDRLDETTAVSVGTDGRVAGREAYELVLEPRTDQTLVGEIRVAIDGENGAALAASVTARGAEAPAFETGFTDVSFAAPDASVFAFEPSDAYVVAEEELPLPTVEELRQWLADAQARAESEADAATDRPRPIVHGEGWATVVELDAATVADMSDHPVAPATEPPFTEGEALDLLDTLTTPVEGGRALQTSLLSVLFTDDGRVLAGSVPVDALVEFAESGR